MLPLNIRKSFALDCEPSLSWPRGPVKLLCHKGLKLSYLGIDGTTYRLDSSETSSVQMVAWDLSNLDGWREMFDDSSMQPNGLRRLSSLRENLSENNVCSWVSQNGPLGLHPSDDSVKNGISLFSLNRSLIPECEPVDCIRAAARRASNVVRLWEALKRSYLASTGNSVRSIRSIIKFMESDPLGGNPTHYRVLVNGEPRSARPIPTSSFGWRKLANLLLAEYINDHLGNNVRMSLDITKQNKDEEGEIRCEESTPDWNLKPTWCIKSALTAYYVELLMVMRRFRGCANCGRDISHQKPNSACCGGSCRVALYRKRAKLPIKLASGNL